MSEMTDEPRILTGPPRPFDPITDCPRCKTVTAHYFRRREADPDAELVEVRSFTDDTPSYIPTGPLQSYTERECVACNSIWSEDLPPEWKP